MNAHTLLEKVSHDDFKAFARDQLAEKGFYKKAYHTALLLFSFSFAAAAGFGTVLYIMEQEGTYLLQIVAGLIFSFTFLIVIHELLHGLAYKITGAKRVYFGAVLRKFVFYAGSDQETFNGKQYRFIALFPFLCITTSGLIGLLLLPKYFLFILTVLFLHTLFCGGDFAIMNFTQKYDLSKLHTSDSREKKETYFYLES